MTHPDRTSSVVGGYMIFYSLGSAVGAITTTTVFAGAGWTGSSILGAAFAVCALVVWASSRRLATSPRSLPRDDRDRRVSGRVSDVAGA
jgi:predicted MFS family arabinose efflux permease